MDGIAPPSTSWKPVVILLYDIRMWEVGFLYTNKRRAFLQFRNTPQPTTRLVFDSTVPSSGHHPLSHHLNQLYASKFIQSLPMCWSDTFIYWHKKGGLSTPCVLLKKYLDVTPLGVMNSSVAEKCKHLIWIVDFWIKFWHYRMCQCKLDV